MEPLHSYLSRYITLTNSQFDLLAVYLKEVELAPGDYFLREGNVCRTIGFVIQGTLRVLHFDQGDEVTRYFIPQGNIAVLPDSFRYQAPSTENIQAVTKTKLCLLRYEDMTKLFAEIPAWGRLVQKLVDEVQRQRALGRWMVGQPVPLRLNSFREEYPGLLETLPLHTMASYLRLAPSELKNYLQEMSGNQPPLVA